MPYQVVKSSETGVRIVVPADSYMKAFDILDEMVRKDGDPCAGYNAGDAYESGHFMAFYTMTNFTHYLIVKIA